MQKGPDRNIQLLSFAEDQPRDGKGLLIPRRGTRSHPKHTFTPASTRVRRLFPWQQAVVFGTAAVALFVLGTTGFGLVSQWQLAAAPTVTIIDPYTRTATSLSYGPQAALSQERLFTDTRDSFIEEGLSFIEIDLASRQLRSFKKGVLFQSATIEAVGERGSWWDTPSGLYQVEAKHTREFSTVSQVYLPWQLVFERNFAIHGRPEYPDGSVVSSDYTGGGIRLANEAAELLYEQIAVGTPVLVHATKERVRDVFVYEPQVPELATPHYFIADIDNGTILAATDLRAVAPIASLTKLMTAVVAAEELDLDGRVHVTAPTFVTSLIPRLSERSSVSMYSLLQLLLVESSNEAAETIAGEMGRTEFIAAMNAKARQLGMMDTNFADPSGLSAENTSSLTDLYKLTKYIHEDRRFIFEITAKEKVPSAYVGGEFGGLINFNEVEDMDSFVGGKVGETLAAGQTSISLHRITIKGQERTLAVIMLGSKDRTADITTLLSYAGNRFGW